MRTSSGAWRLSGFSLLEMLVVLLIAGMALTLTAQAVGQYQRAHASAAANERAGRQYRLSESWFRASVRGLVAIAESPLPPATRVASSEATPPQFAGDPQGFSGTTLLPVLAGQGIPTLQQWEVRTGQAGTDVLHLSEEGEELQLSLPGRGGLRLHYLDAEGGMHDQWPPAQGTWPQLPGAVVLEVEGDEDGAPAMTIVAAIAGPADPLELPYEEEPI